MENGDIGGLDDLDQSNQDVVDEIADVYDYWFTTTGADAARVDAARSMSKDYLADFEAAIGVQTFGEVFHGDVAYVADYQDYEWSVLDFPLFFNARDVFANDGDFDNIKNILDNDWRYAHPERLMTFIDNHDRDRFLALADDNYDRLRSAMTFLFTVRGIPVTYYGTEQALTAAASRRSGRASPTTSTASRRQLQRSSVMFQWIERLADVREDYPQLASGTQREMWVEDHVFAYCAPERHERRRGDRRVQQLLEPGNAHDPASLREHDLGVNDADERAEDKPDRYRGVGRSDRQADHRHDAGALVGDLRDRQSRFVEPSLDRHYHGARALQRRIRQRAVAPR